MGSHTADTFSIRSQAAFAPPDHAAMAASNAVVVRSFI
jgi:hypothetical protein